MNGVALVEGPEYQQEWPEEVVIRADNISLRHNSPTVTLTVIRSGNTRT